MIKRRSPEAPHVAIGFYYQSIYSLVVLLGANDDESISVESVDDIKLEGPGTPRLMQLKHSLKPSTLTERDDGLWNTIANWLSLPGWRDYHFFFVTCDQIPANSDLKQFRPPSDTRTTDCFQREATRVLNAVSKPRKTKDNKKPSAPIAYKQRLPGCKAFLALSPPDRDRFLQRLWIIGASFQADQINREVESLLRLYPLGIRPRLAERLIEWWDRRVARSLLKLLPRSIPKSELLANLHEISLELTEDNLPDDYGAEIPPTLDTEVGTVMEQQIQLVNGGPHRINRAALARWRARNQRARWLDEFLEIAPELARFDDALKEHWRDRHQPMCYDLADATEHEKKQAGLGLLDWSHNDAHRSAPPLRPNWSKPFLVQGTYQQFAEEREVGWHPDFLVELENLAASGKPSPRDGDSSKRTENMPTTYTNEAPK